MRGGFGDSELETQGQAADLSFLPPEKGQQAGLSPDSGHAAGLMLLTAPGAAFLAQHGLVQSAPQVFDLTAAQHCLVQLAPQVFWTAAQHGLVQLAPHAF